ncbi:ATP-binding SpoIIE family protein phosphatase [Cerasicoccus fimbriatus]|uniref:ATP-binding SpoIIE family protein phosphatase n=1 Tax=Cerasicoccus fimbriatus TaxID=3014554 RepID=UPI0022B5A3D6|nr:ATP-binding SpoIIE family protein phosphatase [Cerasicoccus sp. TK19100]
MPTNPSFFLQTDTVTSQRARVQAAVGVTPLARQKFVTFLESCELPTDEINGWKLIFTELLTNAIVHGAKENPAAEIMVEWSLTRSVVRLSIQDPGTGPATARGEGNLPEDIEQENGRGRFLIKSFVDSLQEWHGPSGYRVDVEKHCAESVGIEPPSDEMQSILNELSASYEGLAAFYQLSESLVKSDSLSSFLESSLTNVRGNSDLDYLQIIPNGKLPVYVMSQLEKVSSVMPEEAVTDEVLELVRRNCEIIWEDEHQRNDLNASIPLLSEFSSGCLLPITSETQFFGMLAAGRISTEKRLVSSHVNNLRTFAEIFGISIANFISTTIRQEAEKDLREFEIAADIQQHLLPVRQPTNVMKQNVRVFQRVAQNVAGDFAEYCQDRLGNHYVTIIDVMGKGVSAALLGIIYRAAFNLLLDNPKPLPVMLQQIGRILNHMLGDLTMFITVTILRWSDDADICEHVNAGHCPTIRITKNGDVQEFEPSGPPIGLMPSFTYTSDVIEMGPEDRIVMVSDGCYEWRYRGELYGWERLIELMRSSNYQSGAALWRDLCDVMDEDSSTDALSDDITMVFIRQNNE